ncbi:MAG TPA: hypothetical protein VJ084_01255, partial [Nitrospinota bacterium]|nr:hypothetical protein [Nitrospinota bacterium]
DTLMETQEDIDPKVLTLPALDLDRLLEYKLNKNYTQGGHDVPRLSFNSEYFYCNYKRCMIGY